MHRLGGESHLRNSDNAQAPTRPDRFSQISVGVIMAAPQVANRFIEQLKRSRLVSTDRLAAFLKRPEFTPDLTAVETAQFLIRAGILTTFQAERLLAGHSRGLVVGRYKLLEILGTGGMGRLYVAEDMDSGERVAIKMLPERQEADAGLLARFKIEARAGAMLTHPNITKTHSIDHMEGIFGDVYYLVMEFVEGISLEELIVLIGRPAWPQACDLIRQAADGLECAHAGGLIHRDIKPANLLVDRAGHVKLLDFGLSLYDTEGDEFSLAMIFGHDCLGTADYIAPEQTIDSYKVDARADVYSLGCTFYAALTAKVPFGVKRTNEKLEAHRTLRARPVSDYVPEIPAEVSAIVDKMMAKDPKDRFQTAADVSRALAPFATPQPVQFDFRKILAMRANHARQRAALADQRSKTANSTSKTSQDQSSCPADQRPSASAVETVMRDDTKQA